MSLAMAATCFGSQPWDFGYGMPNMSKAALTDSSTQTWAAATTSEDLFPHFRCSLASNNWLDALSSQPLMVLRFPASTATPAAIVGNGLAPKWTRDQKRGSAPHPGQASNNLVDE